MAHICGGEQIGLFTLLDALAQHARGAEIGGYSGSRRLAVAVAKVADHLAQAARGKHTQLVRLRRADHRGGAAHGQQYGAQAHQASRYSTRWETFLATV